MATRAFRLLLALGALGALTIHGGAEHLCSAGGTVRVQCACTHDEELSPCPVLTRPECCERVQTAGLSGAATALSKPQESKGGHVAVPSARYTASANVRHAPAGIWATPPEAARAGPAIYLENCSYRI